MTYIRVGRDLAGPFGEFGSSVASPVAKALVAAQKPVTALLVARPSIAHLYRKRRPEWSPVTKITKAQLERIRAHDARMLQRLLVLKRLPVAQVRKLGASLRSMMPLGALGVDSDDAAGEMLRGPWADFLASAFEEMRGLEPAVRDRLGTNMLTSRAASAAAELGIDITRRDLGFSALPDLAWRSSGPMESVLGMFGGSDAAAFVKLFGDQISAAFKSQGFSITRALGGNRSLEALADTLNSAYGNLGRAWDSLEGRALEAYTDLVAFAETGFRDLAERLQDATEDVRSAIPEEWGAWLNERTLSQAWDVVQSTSDAVESGSPGAIARAAGNGLMLGSMIPGPVGAGFAAAGGFVSMLGGLFDFLTAPTPPPPPLLPCEAVRAKDDAWLCLSLFMSADAERTRSVYGFDPPNLVARPNYWMDFAQQLRDADWDVKIDAYTGEVVVKVGGSTVYKRVLDLFDRQKLLDSFVYGGTIRDFVMGPGVPPVNLWCMPPEWMCISRFLLADKVWSGVRGGAKRFRVRFDNDGNPVPGTGLAPGGGRDTDWQCLISGCPTECSAWDPTCDPEVLEYNTEFVRNYRAACVISAYLGGTVPFGALGNGICTGVGARYEGMPGSYLVEYPFACRYEDGTIYVVPPRNSFGSIDWKRDAVAILRVSTPTKGAREELSALVRDEGLRTRYRIPRSSPPLAALPATTGREGLRMEWVTPAIRKALLISPVVRLADLSSVGKLKDNIVIESGMSTGAKVALGLGALALVGGGGYWLWKRSKERR